MDQEEVGRLFAQFDLVAVPVVDADGVMKGIVTIDDIVDVVEEEATEDIQKLGGMAALDAPYFQVSLWEMIRARAGLSTAKACHGRLEARRSGNRIMPAPTVALLVRSIRMNPPVSRFSS